jgi:M6 family metalloprotease-like protein
MAGGMKKWLPVLMSVWILLAVAEWQPLAATGVTLSEARFEGLTRIRVTTSVPMPGLDVTRVVITRGDGTILAPATILTLQTAGTRVTIEISSEAFARVNSQGTRISTRAFGDFAASRPVELQKPGEPSANGHILGSSAWTDEGWNTSRTRPLFLDPASGQTGLYRFTDLTPNRDEKGKAIEWKDGAVLAPAHREKNMLVLFVEFPDRRAADAGDPYTTLPAYLDFLRGASEWFDRSSYGQLRFTIDSPQNSRDLGWIMMSKNAAQYKWDGQTHNMFAYVREACQLAYDRWGVQADAYDMLLVMPARGKQGLFNGPGNINRDPTDAEQPNTNLVAYMDHAGKAHYIDTALTAGNDMFRWGYRWLIHEAGHAFGFPDLYMYAPTVNGSRVGAFFYCGGWDMMGNIAGHSTDFLAWHKWKLRWVRDDQVDVISKSASGPMTRYLSPVETPGGSKMVVMRTGLATAYVAEFRTRLGVNALDGRGKYSGILLYRIDASRWEAKGTNPTAQIISRAYYRNSAVGGPKNLTGVWRPIDNTLTGYDSPDCCWQPGDEFSDPATGVTLHIDEITHTDAGDPANSTYSAQDVAKITVTKTMDAALELPVTLRNALLQDLVNLTFDSNVELQQRIPNANANNGGTYTYIREESVLTPGEVIITRANGSVIPAGKITRVTVSPTGVQVTLAKGAFSGPSDVKGATIATRAYFHFGAGAAVPIAAGK